MLNTTNFNLSKPELTDTVGTSIPAISGDMDTIDIILGAIALNTSEYSLNSTGYLPIKIKNKMTGTIITFYIQWIPYTSMTSGTALTFPIAFPNTCLGVLPFINTTSPVSAGSWTKTGFTMYHSNGSAIGCGYFAYGY